MSKCHFCGADNEDWMKICQECGNPVLDSSKKTKEETKDYSLDEETQPKGNKDLIIVLAVLSVVLVALSVYALMLL